MPITILTSETAIGAPALTGGGGGGGMVPLLDYLLVTTLGWTKVTR